MTTGVSPAELFYKVPIRTKIPAVQDYQEEDFQLQVRDRDALQKEIGRKLSDRRQGKGNSSIKVGDVVYGRRLTPQTKWEYPYIDQPLKVIERDGSDVQVKTFDGTEYRRSVSHLIKAPQHFQKGVGIEGITGSASIP